MSVRDIPNALRQEVIARAGKRCEYCFMPDLLSFYPPEIDHVVARKHGGQTTLENLARICWRCNRHKGTDLTSLDPLTGELTRLFNPRIDHWSDHFALQENQLISDTAIGRTTISLLRLNTSERLAERSLAATSGQYP
ncbi:MAG: HNH endonuclease signature motif containing protein [Chloroflexota bacterium]